jgi:hypothetical protein
MIEGGVSRATREFAERLLAYETALDRTLETGGSDTCLVCEKLRRSLDDLLGPDAYSSIAARALDSARLEAPVLTSVEIREDGSIEGLSGEARRANSTLIAHLIGLMDTFIGETVTLWLLDDIWPTLRGSKVDARQQTSNPGAVDLSR